MTQVDTKLNKLEKGISITFWYYAKLPYIKPMEEIQSHILYEGPSGPKYNAQKNSDAVWDEDEKKYFGSPSLKFKNHTN